MAGVYVTLELLISYQKSITNFFYEAVFTFYLYKVALAPVGDQQD